MLRNTPLPLGTPTRWGPIAAISFRDGERYYFMIDKHKTVSLMPADVVEPKEPQNAFLAP